MPPSSAIRQLTDRLLSLEPRASIAVAICGYNLVQNYLVPRAAYVPTNLAAAAGLVHLARLHGFTDDQLGLTKDRVGDGLRLGLAGAGAAASLSVASALSPWARGYLLDERAQDQSGAELTYNAMIRFPLGTAFFEEVVFRGVVEGVWQQSGASPSASVLADAILFAAWHIVPTARALPGNPVGSELQSSWSRALAVLAGAAASGLAAFGFSWLRRRSGSVIAPWLTHAALNTSSYLAGVVVWRLAGSDRV